MINKELLYSLLIYGGTFLSSCMCVYLTKNKFLRGFFSLLAVGIPSVTAAFRECGIDFVAYESMYRHIRAGTGYETIEPLWYQLNRIMPSYEWLLFASAFIFLGMSYFAICLFLKEDRWLAWFIVLTVCYSTFYNGMRQMIAVSIVFAAVALIYKKKIIPGIVFIALAYFFHESALFMLVILFYLFISKRLRNIEGVIAILTAFSIIGLPAITMLIERIGMYTGYLEEINWHLSLSFLLYSIPPIIPYYIYRKYFTENQLLKMCFDLYMLIIPFQFLGMSINYADRVMLYFQIFIAILIPLMVQEISKNIENNYWKGLYVGWFIFQYVVLNIVLQGQGTYPYMNFRFDQGAY